MFALLLALAQPAPTDAAATLRFVESLRDPATGVYTVTPGGKPNLRAVNGGVKVTRALGGTVADVEKLRAFVLKCIDPKTGGFAEEPGGRVTVPATAVGVITAVELAIPREKFHRAINHLRDHAKTWEEVRIAAAAVEAWGVTDCPFDFKPWFALAETELERELAAPQPATRENSMPRTVGSVSAFELRLGVAPAKVRSNFKLGETQWAAGGWGAAEGKPCDLETTYRIMRALHLLGEKLQDPAKLRAFLRTCRNADGGSAVVPGDPSTMSSTYYAAMVEKWLK